MLLKFTHLENPPPLRITLHVAVARIPCVSVNLKAEGCGKKIRSRKGFLMQMYERERIYKSGYDNLEII
jgi:hypothetical protein